MNKLEHYYFLKKLTNQIFKKEGMNIYNDSYLQY